MALEMVVDSLESVPEAVRGEYAKGEDGKFHLSVNGGEDVSGLKSALQKEREQVKELKAKAAAYEGIDPAKATEALEKLRQIEEKELIAKGEVDKVVENRTKLMQQDHAEQVKKLTERAEKAEADAAKASERLASVVIERDVSEAVNLVGQPRKNALLDILHRARQTWRLDEDGKPVATNPDGTTIYGKDGKAPISMKEWAETLLESAPHLFEESKGGGARGSVMGGNGSVMSAEELAKLTPAKRLAFARGHLKQ